MKNKLFLLTFFVINTYAAEVEPLMFQGDIPDATVRQHILGLGQISVQDVYDESKQALCSLCNTR